MILFAILIALLCPTVLASDLQPFGPYAGSEAQLRSMSSQKVKGVSIYDHQAPQAHVYGGFKFNPFLSIEGGTTLSKSTTNHMSGNKLRARGAHIGLLGHIPILPSLSLLCGLGISHLKVTTFEHDTTDKILLTHDRVGGIDRFEGKILRAFSQKFHHSRFNPRTIFGFQYALTDTLSFRATGIIERTSNMQSGSAKLNDTINCSSGFQYAF